MRTRRRAYRKLIATVRAAFRPGHAPHPIRQWRLERFASAGRSARCANGWSAAGRSRFFISSSAATRKSCAGPGSADAGEDFDETGRWRCARTSIAFSFATASSPATACSMPEGGLPELLLHPSDSQTGLSYSLIPMTQAIIGRAFHARRSRAAISRLIRRASPVSGRRASDGQADRLPWRTGNDLPPGGIVGVLRPRNRARCTCIRTCATRRP